MRHQKGAIQTAPCRSSSSFGIIQVAYSLSSQCLTLGWLCCIALWIVDNV
ncbi:MAG: hypothetical protein ACR5LA_10725 [Wolbachia sp.]